MKAYEIINLMDEWAKPYYIDKWDNTGFQIGDGNKEIKKIILSLNIDDVLLEKAQSAGADMIITHHPIIFKPINNIISSDYKGRLIMNIIKSDIVVYNAHSNLDICKNGVNDRLADILNLKNSEVLSPLYQEKFYKLVVFVPEGYDEKIRDVLGKAGAGWIGNYSNCTYNIDGMGTFLPLENTHPFIGQKNVLERVKEKRIETIVRKREADGIIEEMIKAHPYEEVAYDLYPLENKGTDYGYGRVGDIEEISMKALIEEIKRKLTVKNIRVYGGENKKINRIAVCGGSGGDFIYDAYKKKAQVYITGDIKYHEAQLAKELGLILIDSNHYDTEKIILPVIKEYILEHTNEKIEVDISDINSYGFQEY